MATQTPITDNPQAVTDPRAGVWAHVGAMQQERTEPKETPPFLFADHIGTDAQRRLLIVTHTVDNRHMFARCTVQLGASIVSDERGPIAAPMSKREAELKTAEKLLQHGAR